MHAFCVVGITWRFGDARALETYTIPAEDRARRLAELRAEIGARELVYLATCNRVEWAVVADGRTPLAQYRERIHAALTGAASPADATRQLRVWAGEGAVEHLLMVAAGLDSAQLGEHEIPGQLRQAVELAEEAGTIGPELEWLLHESLRLARSARSQSSFGGGRLSLAEIALERVERRLDEQNGVGGGVALVGVSPMTQRCGERLARRGVPIVVVNRHEERAREFVRAIGGRARGLDDFRRQPDPVDVVVSATSAPEPLFRRATLERLAALTDGGGPLLVDLAIPPDIDAEAAAAIGLDYIGMDEITAEAGRNSAQRREDAASARELVDEALDEILRQRAERTLSPIIAALQRRYRETAVAGIDRLLAKELAGLAAPEQAAVRSWAEMLARRLAHIPTTGLRALASDGGMASVRTFLAASKDPILTELLDTAATLRDPSLDEDGR